mmetsp:Transcript_17410/g.50670  ORF Transcript_17410/g.50670 Transcript_17410/m.50670 type:complete len:267 (+) Transcript_17410:1709-2509(+)
MRIAVQHSRIEEHGQVRVDRHAAQTGHVGGGVPVESGTLDPFGQQHLVPDVLFHHGGGAHGVQAAGAHGRLEGGRILRLEAVVGLGDESSPPFVHQQQGRVDVLPVGLDAVGEILEDGLDRGEETEDVQIQGDFGEYARALDLDGDVLPGLEGAAVHLSDGRGRHGFVRQRGEYLGQFVHAQFLPQYLPRLLGRKGGDRILEGPQLQGVGLGHQIGTNRQRLSQLDEGRSQFLAQRQRILRPLRFRPPQRRIFLVPQEFPQNEPVE